MNLTSLAKHPLIEKYPRIIVFIGLAIIGLLVFGNVLNGEFLLDDEVLITSNTFIHSWSNLLQLFSDNVSSASSASANYYHPLATFVRMFIVNVFGLNRIAFHAVSLILHILNSLMVYFLLRRFKFLKRFSFFGAVFFMIHPVQVEAVSFISNMPTLLGIFFVLMGSLTYIRCTSQPDTTKRWRDAFLVILCYLAALSSTEITFIFPFLLIFIDLALHRSKPFKSTVWKTPLYFIWIAIMAVFFFYRYKIFPLHVHGLWSPGNIYAENSDVRGLTFIGIIWQYAKLIVFPLKLYVDRPLLVFASYQEWPVIFGLLTVLGGLGLTIWLTIKKKILPIFIFFWFFTCLIPFMGIVPVNAIYQEHWLYGSLVAMSAFIVGVFAILLERTKDQKQRFFITAIFVMLLVCYGARDILRNNEWATNIEFCKNELKINPNSSRFNNELAMAYGKKGQLDHAIYYYKQAITISDKYPQIHHNLARVLIRKNQMLEALNEYYLSLRMDPNYIYSHIELQSLYEHFQDKRRADVHAQFAKRILQGDLVHFYEIKQKILGY